MPQWLRCGRAVAVATVAGAVALIACTANGSTPRPSGSSSAPSSAPSATGTTIPTYVPGEPTAPAGVAPKKPNIVFVLTDDLSTNLIKYMPHVQALQATGMTFTNYTVADSLCCPSRASIFTGNFPHNTKITGNSGPDGGFDEFTRRHEDHSTFATSLSAVGYRTGFIGKYLNEYEPTHPIGYYAPVLSGAYVPPGWDVWHGVDGGGYNGYDYNMAYGRDVKFYGKAPQDYFTTVAEHSAVDFLRGSAGSKNPFLLEVATYAPHNPYTPAPQDLNTFTGLRAPRSPAFNRKPTNPPTWLAGHAPLGTDGQRSDDRQFQLRVEDVQAVDRLIGALQRVLVETGKAANTVFVFSSDNGYHLGEYTLLSGKQTAYDTDIRVPLVVSGPGIPADTTTAAVAQNIDLRPTFDALAGTQTPSNVDGHSLLPILLGTHPTWRTLALVEHVKDSYKSGDPDRQTAFNGVPPTYDAIRSADFLYVRYVGGDREYYDLRADPYELHNLARELSTTRRAQLDAMLNRLKNCRGTTQCWAAGDPRSS